jgi:hypothetical protein
MCFYQENVPACTRTTRGTFIVCGALGQCSVQGPRPLKKMVGCGCMLDALLFIRTKDDRTWKTLFLLHV